MAAQSIQRQPPPKEDVSAAGDLKALMAAFEVFREHADKLTESYERLQAHVAHLSRELELKNRALEASLHEQRRLHHSLQSIVNSLHHGVIAVDLAGNVTLFNRRAAELTHKRDEEVLGKPYAEVFPKHPSILLDTLRSSRPEVREFENYLGDGSFQARYIEVTTALVRDDRGVPLGAVEVLRDLTEWREMEAQLRRANMLAALGEVAVSIAHEIRNPLGAIQLFVEMLGEDNLPPQERQRVLDGIFGGIKLMNNTISNLLQFTRPMAISTTFQNLATLLDQSLTLCEHAFRAENIAVKREYPPIGLMCHVDESQFAKAMLNLILNAAQAMQGREERTLTIRARRQEATASAPTTEFFQGTPWIDLEIEDSGCGISPNMIERVFTPFVTTKEHGVGLGLPIVHNIVQAHGGRITIESKVGLGTCVRLMLPVYREPSSQPSVIGHQQAEKQG